MPLVTLTRLVGWVFAILLSAIFPALKASGIIADVSETWEVDRLIIAQPDSGRGSDQAPANRRCAGQGATCAE